MIDFKQYEETVYQIIGSAMFVHKQMGWGLLEPLYNECLHLDLLDRGIENSSEVLLPCYFKHHKLKKTYKMDLVVGDDICVELKSVSDIVSEHRAQLFNYLRLTKKPIGLLINFGRKKLQGERYGYNSETNECILLDKNMNIVNNDLYINY